MVLHISSDGALKILGAMIAALFVGNAFSLVCLHGLGYDNVFGLVPLFDFNGEANLPSFFSSLLFLAASALLLVIGVSEKRTAARHARHWLVLAAIFAFLCIDEFSSIHERLNDDFRPFVDQIPFLYYAWLIPYAVLGVVLAAAYLPFLLALPSRVRRFMVAGGAVFVLGAAGFELIASSLVGTGGSNTTLGYALLYSVEESLEMAGLTLFIHSLLQKLELAGEDLRFSWGPSGE